PLEEKGAETEGEEEKKDGEMGEEIVEKPRRIGKRQEEVAKETDKEDIWEIPAFLRRRKRR
ncbi:MAG: hypothetical protein AAB524_01440, partial [Patescibacteria group bacterium]